MTYRKRLKELNLNDFVSVPLVLKICVFQVLVKNDSKSDPNNCKNESMNTKLQS